MPIVFGHDKSVADWAGKQFGMPFVPPYTAWGVIDDTGTLTGALIFNEFQRGGNISLSLVGASTIRRDILRRAAVYTFNQLRCSRVTARTRRDNVVTRRILSRSWEFEGVAKRWFGPNREDDALCFVLFPEKAERWIKRPCLQSKRLEG
jgi:hypothetical protein